MDLLLAGRLRGREGSAVLSWGERPSHHQAARGRWRKVMIIGGSDILIEAPPDAPVVDFILSRVRLLWPDAWFQAAEEDECRSIHHSSVYISGGKSREFFIYRDHAAVEAWAKKGATVANLETMLYFIIGDQPTTTDTP